MKINQLLQERIEPNAYFVVRKVMPIWFAAGYKETNASYGRSRISQMTYNEKSLFPGDEIHWLQGGMFAVTPDGVKEVSVTPPDDRSPFERGPNPFYQRQGALNRLEKDGKIDQISREMAKNVKYRQ